jgi:mannose-6-phosphate isomerase-like protein (cupin superfamily)
MRLESPFLKLPIRFDADVLAAEVRALPPSAWTPHPTGFEGNEAVRLVTVDGEPTDDFKGQMAPTEHLIACPYIGEIMAELGGVWGRSRLMGLGAGGEVPKHLDSHYYWRTHWRIHIPVITNPAVTFMCGGETVHMGAGECWMFDSFRQHRVHNGGREQRVHLVLDTVGGSRLWDLMDAAKAGSALVKTLVPCEHSGDGLAFEKVNSPKVMSPWEIRTHVAFLLGHAVPHPRLEAIAARLERFIDDWAVAWAQFGTDDAGLPDYLRILGELKRDLGTLGGADILLRNGLQLYLAFDHVVLVNLLDQPILEEAPSRAAIG